MKDISELTGDQLLKVLPEFTVGELLEVLNGDHAYHWLYAASALGKLREVRAVEPILDRFKKNPYATLATALGNLGDERAVEPLIQVLEQELPTVHPERKWRQVDRYYYVRALGKLSDKRALPVLEKMLYIDTEPVLKGRSLSDMAAKAIACIQENQG